MKKITRTQQSMIFWALFMVILAMITVKCTEDMNSDFSLDIDRLEAPANPWTQEQHAFAKNQIETVSAELDKGDYSSLEGFEVATTTRGVRQDQVDLTPTRILLRNIDGTYNFKSGDIMNFLDIIQNLSSTDATNVKFVSSVSKDQIYQNPIYVYTANEFKDSQYIIPNIDAGRLYYAQMSVVAPNCFDACFYQTMLSFVDCNEFELGRSEGAECVNNDYRLSTTIFTL